MKRFSFPDFFFSFYLGKCRNSLVFEFSSCRPHELAVKTGHEHARVSEEGTRKYDRYGTRLHNSVAYKLLCVIRTFDYAVITCFGRHMYVS